MTDYTFVAGYAAQVLKETAGDLTNIAECIFAGDYFQAMFLLGQVHVRIHEESEHIDVLIQDADGSEELRRAVESHKHSKMLIMEGDE